MVGGDVSGSGPGGPTGRRDFDVANRQMVERLSSIEERLADVTGLVYEGVQLLRCLVEGVAGPLPIQEDGACPECGGTSVAIPEAPERQSERACKDCKYMWQVAKAVDEGEGDEGG